MATKAKTKLPSLYERTLARGERIKAEYARQLAAGEIVPCPVEWCTVFPDDPEGIAEHVSRNCHVFSDGTWVKLTDHGTAVITTGLLPFSSKYKDEAVGAEFPLDKLITRHAVASEVLPTGTPTDRHSGDGTGPGKRRGSASPYTWTKAGEDWAVRVPVDTHEEGDVVEVRNRKGEVKEVKLGRKVEAGEYLDVHLPQDDRKNDTPTFRWTKTEWGEWAVSGPEAVVGQRITITKKDGEVEAFVLDVLGGDHKRRGSFYLYKVEKAETREAKERAATLEPGLYREPGTTDIIKVQVGRQSGRPYAGILRELDEPIVLKTKTKTHEFEFVPGLLNKVKPEWRLDVEEAKAWGRETGTCCNCGAELTKKSSIEAGIGPICASKV